MRATLLAAVLAVIASTAAAKNLMSQQEALAGAFPPGTAVERQSVFLSPQQLAAAKSASGVDVERELVVRYVGRRGTQIVGYAYFDAHRVRTLPETVMVVVTPDARIQKVDILSFSEPADYLPKRRWLDQIHGAKLSDELSLKKSIRPISGASLSGRAIVNASRRILAVHQAIENAPASRAGSASR